ncbi:MAG TPA: cell wall-binding repeat-containing protein, partial [Euzebya sp.]|nr:cell wall-binding repeat-containing protein [Euzebya sp.]
MTRFAIRVVHVPGGRRGGRVLAGAVGLIVAATMLAAPVQAAGGDADPVPRGLGGGPAGQPLVPGDVAGDATYGSDVAIDAAGDLAVVGAPLDAVGGVGAGSATVFRRAGQDWIEITRLAAPDGGDGDRFGTSVAIDGDGDVVVIGAPGVDGGDGAVYVFEGPGWDPQAAVRIPAPAGGSFGFDVALDDAGDTLVVGSPGGLTDPGSAWLFAGPDWLKTPVVELAPGEAQAGTQFGATVSVSAFGLAAAVGAPQQTVEEVTSGAAFVFRGEQFAQVVVVRPPGAAAGDRVGTSVALDAFGGRLLVGAPGQGPGGAVWRFEGGDDFADETAASLLIEAQPEAEVGAAVAVSHDGSTVLVGAPGGPGAFLVEGVPDPAEAKAAPLPPGPHGFAVDLDQDGVLCLLGMLGDTSADTSADSGDDPGAPAASSFASVPGSAGAASFRHIGSTVAGTVVGAFDPDPDDGFEPATTGEALVFLCYVIGANVVPSGLPPANIDSAGSWGFGVPVGIPVQVVATASVTSHSVMPPFGDPNPCGQTLPSPNVMQDVSGSMTATSIVLSLPKRPLDRLDSLLEPAIRQTENLPPGVAGPIWHNYAGSTAVAFQACAGASSAVASVHEGPPAPGGGVGRILAQADLTESAPFTDMPPGVSRYTGTIEPIGEVQEVTVQFTVACPDGTTDQGHAHAFLDPSGTVLDTFGRPVAGATIVLYRRIEDGGPFVAVPDGNGPACSPVEMAGCEPIMDPAINTQNPDVTTPSGAFRWDVVAGTYMLRAYKAGCHRPGDPEVPFVDTVVTPEGDVVQELPVPPERLDLTLILDCGDPLPPFDGDPGTTERLDVADPVAAAVAISQLRFPDPTAAGPAHVVLARADDFPDSLAGAALSATGPLLLTDRETLSAVTGAEIVRVLELGGRVYVLGGDQAVGPAVAAELADAGYDVVRLAGPSRVETAIAVADEIRTLYQARGTVALARAFGTPDNPTAGWADSVTGGAWAAQAGVPILVTSTEGLHPAVADWLTRDGPASTVLLGGTAALSPAVADAVPGPRRIAGDERAGTAAAIATDLIGGSAIPRFLVLHGFRPDGFGFGLAAAGLAADRGIPLVVV